MWRGGGRAPAGAARLPQRARLLRAVLQQLVRQIIALLDMNSLQLSS